MRLFSLLACAGYFWLFIQFVFHGFRVGSFLSTVLIMVLGFFFVIWLVLRAFSRPTRRQQAAFDARFPVQQPATGTPPADPDDSGEVVFRVAGVTYENDDGSSRQEILRHLKYGDPPWADDPEDLLCTLEETGFGGEPAFSVWVNGYQVGYVPKKSIRQVQTAQAHMSTCYISSVRILGGGQDDSGRNLSYGCEVTLVW